MKAGSTSTSAASSGGAASAAGPSPSAPALRAEVTEADARALCLLRACEEHGLLPPSVPGATGHDRPGGARLAPTAAEADALWSPEDAAWASRLADETVDAGAPPAAWLARRAQHAQQRLLLRRGGLARLFARRRWRAGGLPWVGGAAAVGLAFGLAADLLGGGPHVNLLAAPVWVIVVWNIGVLLALAAAALRGGGAGPLRRGLQRALGGAPATAAERSGGVAAPAIERAPESRFALLWARTFAPVVAARAALLLHVAALALAAGLVAGMYARALVLDFRVGWQSTLLEPPQVHGLLATVLAPASALTGLAVPGAQAVAALRHDGAGRSLGEPAAAASSAPAAVWLHLLAATLGWSVALPRAVLAALAAAQAARRARHLHWPVADAYALKLLRSRRGRRGAGGAAAAALRVWPHGFAPGPAVTLALRGWLAGWAGEQLDLQVQPTTAYGDEDKLRSAWAAATPGACLVWFELAATPEPQVQGRFLAEAKAMAGAGALAMLVDESGYRQRLGSGSPRLAERRRAWQALAHEAGVGCACVDLLLPSSDAGGAGPLATHALDAAFAATVAAATSPGGRVDP